MRTPSSLVVVLALAGCSVVPPYQAPSAPVPASYKEAPESGATWLPAAPADALERGPWWTLFADPDLDALEAQIEISNQNVAQAVATYAQAQALVREQRAALFPVFTLDGSARRSGGNGQTGQISANSYSLTAGASWDADLWGRLRAGVTAAQAGAQASEADLAGARLSAQGTLATDYFSLRESDAEIELLRASVEGYERALVITQNRYTIGVAPKTDVLQAQTQLANTRADLATLRAQRARFEHAIAVLVGKAPGDFALAVAPWRFTVPAAPLGVPSTLLERRPDIASSERAVAQANAQIGVQRSAYFPSVALSASFGTVGASVSQLFSASGTLWSLGVSVAQTLFDFGATRARVEQAEAARDVTIASYRQTVLSAFQTVEDQLAGLHWLTEQEGLRRDASTAADLTEQQILNRYNAGQVTYTDVVTAQISALSARRTLVQVQLSRQSGAVALIQALGGGWQSPFAPSSNPVADAR
jgi:NodT family efflux transporter outer membrane factor (OMF) lipoprotein